MHFLTSAIAALALFDIVVFANPHASGTSLRKRHLGRSPTTPPPEGDHNTSSFEKRADNVRFSFFDPGLGACGGHNSNSDFIVALNTPMWDGGSHCGKSITIRYKGKTAQATIVDRCVECPYGGLDFSRGLFDYFASQSEGYLWGGSWDYGSGAPLPKPKPETTSQKPKPTPKPEPTTTATTTTKEAPTTTTTSKTKTSSKPTNTSTSTTATNSATPTEKAAAPPPDSVLLQLNMVLMGLAGVAAAAAQD